MTDLYRLVFDRLREAGTPDQAARAKIYELCRAEVIADLPDPLERQKKLEQLEKVIRRQEMQALFDRPGNCG